MLATGSKEQAAMEGLDLLLAAYSPGDQVALTKLYAGASEEGQRLLEDVLKITSRALDAKQAGGSTKRADTALVVPEGASLQKICRFNGLSYLMPLRKKLHMQLFADALHLNNADTDAPELRVTYDQIKNIIVLPTPERVKTTWTFIMLGATDSAHIAWSLPDSQDVDVVLADKAIAAKLGDIPDDVSSKDMLVRLLNAVDRLPQVDVPDDEFKNARREPFVRCYLKGKEGYLFLLQHGVIFGLKKPIIYIPFGDITDIQTQATSSSRTLSMTVVTGDDRYEFGTMDGADLPAIEHFIDRSKHALRATHKKRKPEDTAESEHKRARGDMEGGDNDDSEESSEDEDYNPHGASDDDDLREEYSSELDSGSGSDSGSESESGSRSESRDSEGSEGEDDGERHSDAGAASDAVRSADSDGSED